MNALFLIVFSNLLGFGIIIPLLPYYAEEFGANPNEVTLLMASYSLMQLIFSPILGRISDIYGRKKILILCLIGSAISYLLLYISTNFLFILFARSVAGLFVSGLLSLPNAALCLYANLKVCGERRNNRDLLLIGAIPCLKNLIIFTISPASFLLLGDNKKLKVKFLN